MEAIRALREVRQSAVNLARRPSPDPLCDGHRASDLREKLRELPTAVLIATLARTRPIGDFGRPRLGDQDGPAPSRTPLPVPSAGDQGGRGRPRPSRVPGGSPPRRAARNGHRDGRTAADHRRRQPHGLRSEASFAHLCAAALIRASPGRTNGHRINRGGYRHANSALYTIVRPFRVQCDSRARDYVARCTAEGMSAKDVVSTPEPAAVACSRGRVALGLVVRPLDRDGCGRRARRALPGIGGYVLTRGHGSPRPGPLGGLAPRPGRRLRFRWRLLSGPGCRIR